MQEYFEHIPGNPFVKECLVNMVRKQAIGNSLLFAGPKEAAKDQFALALAKILLGDSFRVDAGKHPDLHCYRPEGKIGMHGIASMRQFCEEVYLPAYESPWKVFIIHDAERMLTYSANALLKTFEEPASDSVIILLSDHPSALLPTILSRCRTVRFQSVPKELTASKTSEHSEIFTLLSNGKVGTYTELSKAVSQIADRIEEIQKVEEEKFKAEMQTIPTDQMNAFQRQSLEKEIEGLSSLSLNEHAKGIFRNILSWYRDLHLIHACGRLELLENPSLYPALEQAYQRGEIKSLEMVEDKIKQAILSLERSTALNLCLEKLLLELDFISH